MVEMFPNGQSNYRITLRKKKESNQSLPARDSVPSWHDRRAARSSSTNSSPLPIQNTSLSETIVPDHLQTLDDLFTNFKPAYQGIL